jgi:glycerol 3-phosphatase-2
VPLSPRVRSYDHVLLDLDGCVWVGEDALPGAVDAVAALREAGKSVLFLTNDVRRPPEGFVRKLWQLGFQASLDEVLSVGAALQFSLAEANSGNAFVVGSQALVDTSPTPACGSSTTPSSRLGLTSSWSAATTS